MFRVDARGAKTEPQLKLGEYRNILPFTICTLFTPTASCFHVDTIHKLVCRCMRKCTHGVRESEKYQQRESHGQLAAMFNHVDSC